MGAKMSRQRAAIVALCIAPFIIGASVNAGVGDESDGTTRLTITGEGYDSRPASVYQFRAGVQNFDTDASDGVAENARRMSALRERLRRYGVSEQGFQTSGFNVRPGRESVDGGRDRKGFNIAHQMVITLRDARRTGDVIDALVGQGATDIQGPMVQWEASPEAAARARVMAIDDATARANVYAQKLGMRIRRIVSISDSNGSASDRRIVERRVNAVAATEIDPGDRTTRVNVGMVFELVK